MPEAYGYFLYGISLVTMGGLYAVLTLGLNLHWGVAGMLNVGIAGFFAIGAYTTAILTAPPSELHLGGFEMPVAVGCLAAMLLAAAIAWVVGRICVRLRSDYLAIATIGIGEIFRLVFGNEIWATNGARGIAQIPRPFEGLPEPWNQLAFMALVILIVAAIYAALERAVTSPWGRTMLAIRDNETAARAMGKNVERFRMQAFVIGSALMGLGGALFAHYVKIITPQTTDPLTTTFLVWVMLIAGGAGNNRGAILGALLLWTIWSATEILAGFLPSDFTTRLSYIRVFLIGFFLLLVLRYFRGGLLPERR
ncbi:MAG: branched-chain amino acid ABC transporter permease [Paracoccaceae bacterium]